MAVFPSDSIRTKNWGTEILTDADLEAQLDLLHAYFTAALNSSTGHTHDGTSNQGPKLAYSGVATTFGSGFTTVTAASGDYVLIASDVADSNTTKKALVSDITAMVTPPSAAAQADQETATSTTTYVSPGRQQYHPSAAKAWCMFNGNTAGTNAPTVCYNVSTVQKVSTGKYTITFTTALSSANYASFGMGSYESSSSQALVILRGTQTASTCLIETYNASGAVQDLDRVSLVVFGDQ